MSLFCSILVVKSRAPVSITLTGATNPTSWNISSKRCRNTLPAGGTIQAALACIEALVKTLPPNVLIGGGTMCTLQDVDDVYAAGGRLVVSPHCDARLVAHAVRSGMLAVPGVITPTDAFTALQAGAHALKLFPADVLGAGGLKALASVLPSGTELWPVGAITPSSMAGWVAAGATGFGIGSQLYAPGVDTEAVRAKALE